MPRITSWLAVAAASSALLVSGLSGAPAFADTPTPTPTASAPAPTTATIDLRYAAATSTVTVTEPSTVAQAITQLGLKVDGNDRVQPGRGAAVTNGMKLTIDVVSVTKTTKKQTVKYKTVKKKTKSMMKGKKKTVRKGRTGKVTLTTTTTTVNGQTTTVVTSKKVNRKARSKIVKVGTSRLNLARMKQWNRIARCESGGNWHINTHNGYYGGLQFNRATWRSAGGYKFAKYPHKASKNEQVHVANTLYKKRGFRPWSCKP
jgi:resuscitation-promoting factor RpfB